MTDKLYNLADQLATINTEIMDAEGVITDELEKRLDQTNLALKDKAEGIGRWCLNIKGDVTALDGEIKRLTDRKRAKQNLDKRLKSYVLECMAHADVKKIEAANFNIGVQNSPPSVSIENEDNVPAEFLTIVPEHMVVDKKALIVALKAGKKIEGITLTVGTHLRIR